MASPVPPVKAYRVLGTTDDVTACDLCGRQDLKSTVALQPLDPDGGDIGEAVYLGCDCAARATGWTQKDVRRAAGAADRAAREAVERRRQAIEHFITIDHAVAAAREAFLKLDLAIPFSVRRQSPEYAARAAAELDARGRAEAAFPAAALLARAAV